MLNHIRIVLVETSHPGNIGATARAMMTMGLQRLTLVNPKRFPHAQAVARASGALSILEQAHVVPDLATAIADCELVVGTSARSRDFPWPVFSPRQFAEKMQQDDVGKQCAVIFGRERSGLTNDECNLCHYLVQIPTVQNFSSLNIAQAVQLICYELSIALTPIATAQPKQQALATAAECTGFYQQLKEALTHTEFLDPKAPRLLMQRLIRLFNRAHLEKTEVQILRGICTEIMQMPRRVHAAKKGDKK